MTVEGVKKTNRPKTHGQNYFQLSPKVVLSVPKGRQGDIRDSRTERTPLGKNLQRLPCPASASPQISLARCRTIRYVIEKGLIVVRLFKALAEASPRALPSS